MFVRRLHTLPKLRLNPEGVPGLFSAAGLQVAWNDYQQFVLDRLNRAIVDTENETRVPFHIIQATKSKPEQAHIFNYASMAHNNHLFFSTLKTGGQKSSGPADQPHGLLERRINDSFGDLNGLKRAFEAASNQIFSAGFVFLVEREDKRLQVIPCQSTGSPATYSRMQTQDLNGNISEDAKAELEKIAQKVKERQTNWNIELLALNLWQHAYVPDFGIKGRQQYIDAWWKSIDWTKVDDRLFKGRV